MIYKIADNILSPLGETTAANYYAVKDKHSALHRHKNDTLLPDAFTASLFTEEQNKAMAVERMTRFESLVISSVKHAIADTDLNMSKNNVVFILSTTKGNIELLNSNENIPKTEYPGICAARIARHLGVTTLPIVVCNACISGLSAIILASRLLQTMTYDYAIVCGADILTRFTISGFQSFHALSPNVCRPFDIERLGLNLGEAAATIVLGREDKSGDDDERWKILSGTIKNDAYHISTPSKTAEGAFRALNSITKNIAIKDIAFINAHGTATLFNDQMESVAIQRAGLSSIPVNSLKGYYGHTLGAAGVLETVLSMQAIDEHIRIGTSGFEELGVSGSINVHAESQPTDKPALIKMLSGFGGCNAALLASRKKPISRNHETRQNVVRQLQVTHRVEITPNSLSLEGRLCPLESTGKDLITAIYKQQIGGYPKFYKMDMLCRLGFIASELLLQTEKTERFIECEDRAVILFNRSSSLCADKEFWASIASTDNYYPSPSTFAYTLPNIVTGEIAIRNHYHSETSFYILPERNEEQMYKILQATIQDTAIRSVISGWLDYENETKFTANLYIAEVR